MPQVDFYVLSSSEPLERFAFCARLCEKALQNRLQVQIQLAPSQPTEALSQQLWRARPESFLPHSTLKSDDCPIWLCNDPHQSPVPDTPTMLINLDAQPHPMHAQFTRIAEVVIQFEPVLHQTRTLYAHYRSLGYTPATHKV